MVPPPLPACSACKVLRCQLQLGMLPCSPLLVPPSPPGDADKNEGSFAYEQASQLCQKCAAGTWRNYEASTECEPCPEGTYSAEGDATCKACPPGEYNPLQGLADQFEITGYNCVVCAEGSVALNFATFADATATLGALGDNPLVPGATVCDAWCVGCACAGQLALAAAHLFACCSALHGCPRAFPPAAASPHPAPLPPHPCLQPCWHLPPRLQDGLRAVHRRHLPRRRRHPREQRVQAHPRWCAAAVGVCCAVQSCLVRLCALAARTVPMTPACVHAPLASAVRPRFWGAACKAPSGAPVSLLPRLPSLALSTPAGYRLLNAGDKTAIDLCPKGQVSFYTSANQDNGDRVPAGKPEACIACAALADELLTNEWAHTFAPRKGMTQCIPCPGGTIPSNTGSGATYATFSCKACGNGLFRDAYTKSASCAPCGPGKEVGPSSKMACSMW